MQKDGTSRTRERRGIRKDEENDDEQEEEEKENRNEENEKKNEISGFEYRELFIFA